jgi:hypothetical protein
MRSRRERKRLSVRWIVRQTRAGWAAGASAAGSVVGSVAAGSVVAGSVVVTSGAGGGAAGSVCAKAGAAVSIAAAKTRTLRRIEKLPYDTECGGMTITFSGGDA